MNGEHLSDVHVTFDAILDINGWRRGDFGEFLGHVRVLDSFLERREHPASEETRTVDRPALCTLIEQLAAVVVHSETPLLQIRIARDFAHGYPKAVLLASRTADRDAAYHRSVWTPGNRGVRSVGLAH